MQIQDHDEFPKFDHRVLPPAEVPPAGVPWTAGRRSESPWTAGRIFKCHKWGECRRHSHRCALCSRPELPRSRSRPRTDDGLRDHLRNMSRMQHLRALASSPPPHLSRQLQIPARRYLELHDEIADLDAMIGAIDDELAPNLVARNSIG
jgi:hypothetical protein